MKLDKLYSIIVAAALSGTLIYGNSFASEKEGSFEGATFESTPTEVKTRILGLAASGNLATLREFGKVAKDFDAAMKIALSNYRTYVEAHQLTKDNVETLKKVGELELKVLNANDQTMELIGNLTNLRALYLEGGTFGQNALSNLRNLKNLVLIDLSATLITDLRPLAANKELRIIGLAGTNIQNSNLEQIKALENLEVLDVAGTLIDDKGIEHLKVHKNLEALNLSQLPNLTFRVIDTLKELKNLKELILRDTYINEEKLKDLKEALPALEIDYKKR